MVDDDKTQKQQWDALYARSVVMFSFGLQVILTVFAKKRKTKRFKVILQAFIWLTYQYASWVAAFAMGLISSGQETNDVNSQLALLWASTLLLHLGGPDAMTAFSLDDNESWAKHVFGLVLQLFTFGYAFIQSLPNDYWIPVTLMFLAGSSKYIEKTYSLYCASLVNFKRFLLPKPDPGPNYAQFMEEYSALKSSHVPVDIKVENEPEKPARRNMAAEDSLDYAKLVVEGYNFFNDFKGVIVGHRLSSHVINESRKFLFSRKAIDAFRVMEVELNFMYDTLYTKYSVVHSKTGYFFRFLCIVLIVVCFQQFALNSKHNIRPSDITFTYVLLGWAVGLEFLDMYHLLISDWCIVSVSQSVASVIGRHLFKTRRWSNTMLQLNFLSFCLKEPSRLSRIINYIMIRYFTDNLWHIRKTETTESLKEFIFYELKGKAEKAETREIAKEVHSARGEWVLSGLDYSIMSYPSISSSLSNEVEYDESLLMWHIATEICYLTSSGGDSDDGRFCKALSDNMLYLLISQPALMSPVAGIAQVRLQDTCKEAMDFFKRWETKLSSAPVDGRKKLACEMLLNVDTTVKPRLVKGDASKSLLFDACILAKDLNELDGVINEGTKWRMMSRIWVELLSYAAGHCQPDAHAEQLSKGGELITFVWLLMLHFGLGDSQLRTEAGQPGAKLLLVSN